MSDTSDSEEFYDAEEYTPIRGSKRSSISKSTGASESDNEKDKTIKASECQIVKQSGSGKIQDIPEISAPIEDDNTKIKNVVQDRRRFQELRRCIQKEDDDDGPPNPSGSIDQHTFSLDQPFKIIAHDTMSLQSMTSLGRIGRILSGAAESHPNMRESGAIATTSREPSMHSDDAILIDRGQNVCSVVGCEPDVIASTKANSLKQVRGGGAIVAVSGATGHAPLPPPRRNKRKKLHSSLSLSAADGDNLSISTVDTDDCCVCDTDASTPAHSSYTQPSLSNFLNPSQTMPLPSPASTIESLTREFQDSLEMSQTKYAEMSPRERATDSWSAVSRGSFRDIVDNAHHRVCPTIKTSDDERGCSRTHSESRTISTASTGTRRAAVNPGSGSLGRCRRRSAGDPQIGLELTPSLSDMEILEQVTVHNLDTGEKMPLSVAEHRLPQCINPLSLQIMRLTSEYVAENNDDDNARETDEESESVCAGGAEDDTKDMKRGADRQNTIKKKTEKVEPEGSEQILHPLVPTSDQRIKSNQHSNKRLKRFFGSTMKKTVDAAKSLAQEVSHARHKEDVGDIVDEVRGEHNIKLKASNSHKGPYDFDGCVRHVQEMGDGHCGAVWCCKFSGCGKLLATAGQDRLLRIWVARDAYQEFHDMRTKYNAEKKSSPTPSQESLSCRAPSPAPETPLKPSAPFRPKPFCVYSGHTSDLLDVSWSKNYFVLSSSMDKTVRLWHISRGECLCCFQHIDFVTAIVFHPRDDRYFLSGSLDGKLRLWDIPDKKVAVWNEVDGKTKLITAANFCQNGKFAVVGTYDGRCIFYTTDQLKYYTTIDVRSTRGKNSTGRKISGIEPMPNDDKILVTSNDSRIRLYDLRDLNVHCKYKGYVNVSSQIKASFSHDGKYIVSGSENQCIYIWKTYHDYSKFTSVRRDRNDFWEGIKAHNAVVTCAVFAPNPDHMIRMITEREEQEKASKDIKEPEEPKGDGMVASSQTGHVLVSADYNGRIKVFVHKAKPKHSSLPASALA